MPAEQPNPFAEHQRQVFFTISIGDLTMSERSYQQYPQGYCHISVSESFDKDTIMAVSAAQLVSALTRPQDLDFVEVMLANTRKNLGIQAA